MSRNTSLRDFEIRRILLPDEASQIKALQRGAPEFSRHYPRHDQWLEAAIEDILAGKRVAFGVYKLAFDAHHQPKVELVGSIILKKKKYSQAMEMKNLYIRPDCRRKGYGRALYAAVEEYCAKQGCSIIETEVPCAEIGTINYLHEMGFRVSEMRRSPYKDGKYIYRMEKTLFPFYVGDCFDLFEVALWLLRNYYGFCDIVANATDNSFQFRLGHKDLLKGKSEAELKGKALVFDGDTDSQVYRILEASKEPEYSVLLVFTRNPGQQTKRICSEHRIVLIEEQAIYKSFGHLFAHKPPSFPREEIGGMIVAMNPEYFIRLANGRTSFAYFKGGPLGKYLKASDKLLIFSEPTSAYPEAGIRGVGNVVEVVCGSPAQVWDKLKDKNPLFSPDEYYVYAKDKPCVLGVLLDNFQMIPTIGYAETMEIIGEGLDVVDLGHYYISRKMLTEFYRRIDVLAHAPPRTNFVSHRRLIKILFLAANPSDTARLRLDAEVRSIDQAMRQAKFRDAFIFETHWAVRVTDIQDLLLRHEPNIIHFSGHGGGSSGIIFEDNTGHSHPVPTHALSQLFSLMKDKVQCVVLNACYSQQQAEAIAEHIDYVIGMSEGIRDTAAISFSTAFYRALAYGKDIPTAFKLACNQIGLEGLNQEDIPKLLKKK